MKDQVKAFGEYEEKTRKVESIVKLIEIEDKQLNDNCTYRVFNGVVHDRKG